MDEKAASPEEKLSRKRAQWLAYYHRNKHKRKRHPGAVSLAEYKALLAARKAERLAKRLEGKKPRRDRPMTPEERREYNRAWRAAHPGYKKAWKSKNREKVRKDRCGRRGKSNARRRIYLTKLQNGRCAICGQRLGDESHIDHIMPLALGGQDRRSNLQLTHPACNLAKSDMHPVDHARPMGRLL